MMVHMMKSKLHHATVTQAELHYVGSITVDEDLMDAANLIDHEKVQVLDIENGERLETYVIKGERGSGVICMNGPAARKIQKGDTILVISYAMMSEEEARKYEPVVVILEDNNKVKK
ncbi:MAG: aspartate 1-decarboxylase [Bacteroidia bacterium]|nr:aspartate 1-decarboxylase [Bacteroidia bacterium]